MYSTNLGQIDILVSEFWLSLLLTLECGSQEKFPDWTNWPVPVFPVSEQRAAIDTRKPALSLVDFGPGVQIKKTGFVVAEIRISFD
jgi:hypothetical protein